VHPRLQSGAGARPLNFTVRSRLAIQRDERHAIRGSCVISSCGRAHDLVRRISGYDGASFDAGHRRHARAVAARLYGIAELCSVCGYLTLLVFRPFGWVRWWTAACAGAIWSVLFLRLYGDSHPELEAILAWAILGAICGSLYWGVWRHMRYKIAVKSATSNNRWRVP